METVLLHIESLYYLFSPGKQLENRRKIYTFVHFLRHVTQWYKKICTSRKGVHIVQFANTLIWIASNFSRWVFRNKHPLRGWGEGAYKREIFVFEGKNFKVLWTFYSVGLSFTSATGCAINCVEPRRQYWVPRIANKHGCFTTNHLHKGPEGPVCEGTHRPILYHLYKTKMRLPCDDTIFPHRGKSAGCNIIKKSTPHIKIVQQSAKITVHY